jgi:hypothetical protein
MNFSAAKKIFPGCGAVVNVMDLTAFVIGEQGRPFNLISLPVVWSQKTSPGRVQSFSK